MPHFSIVCFSNRNWLLLPAHGKQLGAERSRRVAGIFCFDRNLLICQLIALGCRKHARNIDKTSSFTYFPPSTLRQSNFASFYFKLQAIFSRFANCANFSKKTSLSSSHIMVIKWRNIQMCWFCSSFLIESTEWHSRLVFALAHGATPSIISGLKHFIKGTWKIIAIYNPKWLACDIEFTSTSSITSANRWQCQGQQSWTSCRMNQYDR